MLNYNKIIDYVIEQADRNDGRNLQFEQDILFQIEKMRDSTFNRMIARGSGCMNLTEMQEMLTVLQTMVEIFLKSVKNLLNGKFEEYYKMARENVDQLIEVGLNVEKRYSHQVKETKFNYDEKTIQYIQEHAFEMLGGYGQSIISQLRARLGDLILKGSADRATVQKMIENVLDVNPSKAKEIAQQELSRAYNTGTLERMKEYQALTGNKIRKYWHGFKYSKKTCIYCRDRIGRTYDIDDNSETLPAHIRCRCVWLPVLSGWDGPLDRNLIVRANMLQTGYSDEQIYSRLNNRLGINYAEYMDVEDAMDYLEGDRTPSIMSKIATAREQAIDTTKADLNISAEAGTDTWSKKFNTQMGFWKGLVAEAIVDGDKDMLTKCYDGIKAIMVLPWSGEQLAKWESLLNSVDKART